MEGVLLYLTSEEKLVGILFFSMIGLLFVCCYLAHQYCLIRKILRKQESLRDVKGGLNRQLRFLLDRQRHEVSLLKSRQASSPSSELGAIPLTSAQHDESQLIHNLLTQTVRGLGAYEAVLIFSEKEELYCYAYREKGDALKKVVKQLLTHHSVEKLTHHEYRSDIVADLSWGMLSRLGIGSCLSHPATFQLSGNPVPAVVIIGYQERRFLDEVFQLKTREFVKRLSSALQNYKQLQFLASRVSEVEAQSEGKSTFITHMSHDIRSPLANIQNILGIMSEDLSADHRELIESAVLNCHELTAMLETVIDFSKHASGKLQAKVGLLDLSEALSQVVSKYKFSANLKGLSLSEVLPHQKIIIHADKSHINRILSNLISNAIKYTVHGSIAVQITCQKNTCRIVIVDTGMGMTKEEVAQLFIPFSRFHEEQASGAGLGMSVTKTLIELNGGKIEVHSESGKGTQVVVTFPVCEVGELLFSDEIPTKSPKILIVDDERDLALSLSRRLKLEQGWDCLCASSVLEAKKLISENEIAYVVTDDQMPSGGGAEIVRYSQAMGRSIRNIVLCGYDAELVMGRYVGLSLERVIVKPGYEELVGSLRGGKI